MNKPGAAAVLLLLGSAGLIVVVLTHVAEALHIFPSMGWGLPDSAGHYLDLVSAFLGCALLALGAPHGPFSAQVALLDALNPPRRPERSLQLQVGADPLLGAGSV
jgi:hypothetical protein